jgi:hypothetical protein
MVGARGIDRRVSASLLWSLAVGRESVCGVHRYRYLPHHALCRLVLVCHYEQTECSALATLPRTVS